MVENLSEFVWIGKRGEKIQMLLSHCVFNSLLDIGCMIFPSLKFFFSFRVWYILSQLVSRCFVAFGSFLYVFLIRIRVYCYLFLGLLCMNECYFFFVVDDNTKLDTFVLNNSLWRYTFTKTTFWLETMTSCIYMYTLFFLIFCCSLGTWVLLFFSCYKYIITTENTRQTPSRKFSSSFVLCTHSRTNTQQ